MQASPGVVLHGCKTRLSLLPNSGDVVRVGSARIESLEAWFLLADSCGSTNHQRMANTTTKPAMAFILSTLKKDNAKSYGDLRVAAEKKSLTIYPVMYGRAKKMLGLTKPKAAKAKTAKSVQPAAKKQRQAKGPALTRWSNAAFSATVDKFPALDSRPESVALATWALAQNSQLGPEDFRKLSEKTGVAVRGRAIGSARELLGLSAGAKQKAKSSAVPKRGPGRPRKGSGGGLDSFSDLIEAVKNTERERDRAVKTLAKIRRLLDDG